ncbi:MAG: hypothetical protein JWQ38_2491 [Flavipsychrobacter sp.]|nr:hypothetical protein [Flavipsychrobacter sp.]
MIENTSTLSKHIIFLLNEGQRREEIEQDLLGQGHDEKFVKTLVQECQALRYSQRRTQGLTLILIGAIICFASFLITITSSFTHTSFPYVLFGLTSAGVIVVFVGFTRVF